MIPSPIVLPAAADFHIHLRDGAMSRAVVPTIRSGGVDTVYVMPNLVPPVTSVTDALAYRDRLLAISSNGYVDYLMTLYLSAGHTTPAVVREAAESGVVKGIKVYPQGVTTNSAAGVSSYDEFLDVFAEMERVGLVLNIHGEVPSGRDKSTTVLNAESKFLPTLKLLHEKFPKLRIVLEHCTTRDAVEAVRACGDTVAGTITAHHLYLTVDDWASDVVCVLCVAGFIERCHDPFLFCFSPVALFSMTWISKSHCITLVLTTCTALLLQACSQDTRRPPCSPPSTCPV